ELDLPVKRIPRVIGALDGSKNRYMTFRQYHAHGFGNASSLDAFGFEPVNSFEIGLRRPVWQTHRDIGRHQASRFAPQRVANRFVEARYRCQCTCSQGDGQYKERKFSGCSAGLSPRHAEDESQTAATFP